MGTAVATSVVDHVITVTNAPVVDTKYGAVQGFTIDLENRTKADIFLGVPFAKPPTGELKFESGIYVFSYSVAKDVF
ncbi:acetylcholinesterase [Aphelenchoides avenae]|nr:acetylcholinesterase [Aphelenchus avenae]